MHCCITLRQAENNILASPAPRHTSSVAVSFGQSLCQLIDLLKTNRREIQGGQAKLREILFPQKYVWITCRKRRPKTPKVGPPLLHLCPAKVLPEALRPN